MLQYPCVSISPRPRSGPGEVSSASGLLLSTTIAPDLFLLVAAAGRSSLELVSKVHDQAGHRHKNLPGSILSSPAPAHPLSNTSQQTRVSSPRVRLRLSDCLTTRHLQSCSPVPTTSIAAAPESEAGLSFAFAFFAIFC